MAIVISILFALNLIHHIEFKYVWLSCSILASISLLLYFVIPVTIILIADFRYSRIDKTESIPDNSWEKLSEQLTDYMSENKPVDMLENNNMQIFMNNFGKGVRIRVFNKKDNKMFELAPRSKQKQDLELIYTVWGIIQMYFNKNMTYKGLKVWCKTQALNMKIS